jgi:hypothetical protein
VVQILDAPVDLLERDLGRVLVPPRSVIVIAHAILLSCPVLTRARSVSLLDPLLREQQQPTRARQFKARYTRSPRPSMNVIPARRSHTRDRRNIELRRGLEGWGADVKIDVTAQRSGRRDPGVQTQNSRRSISPPDLTGP